VAADVELPSQRHRAGPRPGPRADAGCRIGGVGWIGAGAFSGAVLLPAFRAAGFDRFVSVASAGGRSAQAFADRHEFAAAAADARAVIDDDGVGVVVIATSHASHAELTVAALERGRHVWCEKPPALTLAELDAVEHAARVGGGVLMVGFNRRFAPAVLAARRRLADRSGPLSIVYRVAAGPVPTEHWYADRRQGGRLLGEVCHFVDTCAVLAGSPVEAVTALAGREAEALLAPDLAVSMRHVDGTLSTVAYSSARPARVGKESIEALAGDRRVRIDDFRRLVVDGHTDWHGAQDKGHRAAVRAFRSRCLSGDADADADAGPGPDRGPYRGPDRGGDDGGAPGSGAGRAGSGRPGRPAAAGLTAELLASSRATLAAAVSLGGPLVPMPAPAGPAPAGPAPAVPAPAGPAADGRGSSGPPRPAAPDDRDIAKETRRA
jgi:predicted dehydrogenase